MNALKIKDIPQYKDLQISIKNLRHRVFNEIYYDSTVSICMKKQETFLSFTSVETILFYLIECPNKEYKIGYKFNIAEQLRDQIQYVPVQSSLDDCVDILCIKDIIRKKGQIHLTFNIKKKKLILNFKTSTLCQEWEKKLKSKIMETKNFKIDREAVRHLESISLPFPPKKRQISCSTDLIPNHLNLRQLPQIPSSYKELTINPFHFCLKKVSQGKFRLDNQDLGLLKTELKRIYALQLSEQNYVKYFMGVCSDMFKTMMTLKREVVLNNQKIAVLQLTNSLLAHQTTLNQINIDKDKPKDYIIQQIGKSLPSRPNRQNVAQIDKQINIGGDRDYIIQQIGQVSPQSSIGSGDQLDSVLPFLQNTFVGPGKYKQTGVGSQLISNYEIPGKSSIQEAQDNQKKRSSFLSNLQLYSEVTQKSKLFKKKDE